MPPFLDLHKLPEDERIKMIGHRAVDHKEKVAFMVDVEDGSHAKGDRYIDKLLHQFPQLWVVSRTDGPVPQVETIVVSVGRK